MNELVSSTASKELQILHSDRFERSALETWHDKVNSDRTSVLRMARIVFIAIFVIGGIWSVSVDIGGAVIAAGRVIAKDRNRVVQHLEGGILSELLVREGDHVVKDQPLAVMDNTQVRAQLEANRLQRASYMVQLARRNAEAERAETYVDPTDFSAETLENERFIDAVHSERAEFNALRSYLLAQQEILDNKILAQKSDIEGTEEVLRAYRRQYELYALELKDFRELLEKGLIRRTQVFATERRIAELEAQMASSELTIEKARNTIVSLENEKKQTWLSYVKDASKQVVATQADLNQLESRIERLEDMYNRNTISSPVDGTVFRIAKRSLGEVVKPGETIMEIFPENDALTIEAYLQLTDIEQVHIGQDVDVVFPSNRDKAMTPIPGKLVYVSADAVVTESNPMGSYVVHVEINPEENHEDLLPGNYAEVYIKTEPKTFLAHVSYPFTRYAFRAFKG